MHALYIQEKVRDRKDGTKFEELSALCFYQLGFPFLFYKHIEMHISLRIDEYLDVCMYNAFCSSLFSSKYIGKIIYLSCSADIFTILTQDYFTF